VKRNRILSLLFVAAAALLPVGAATVYVDGQSVSCDDMGPGSMQVPFCTIQAGYDFASNADELRVMPGTYSECVFAGDVAQKAVDIVADAFVTSGDNAATIIDGTNVVGCTFPGGSPASVVNMGTNTTLSGFTVTGGTASGVFGFGAVAITSNVVNNNDSTSGAGVYVYTANCYYGDTVVSIADNNIANNVASFEGGGVSVVAGRQDLITDPVLCTVDGDATVTIQGNTIEGNSSDGHGGGVLASVFTNSARSASIVITQNTITANTSSSAAFYGYGGGIYGVTYGYGSETIQITGNTIADNASTLDQGGGVSVAAIPNVVATSIDHNVLIENNSVTGNSAGLGGGGLDLFVSSRDLIAPQSISLIAKDNSITGNSVTEDDPAATLGGGGILAFIESLSSSSSNQEFLLDENRITNNSAPAFGGGVSVFAYADADPDDNGNTARADAAVTLDQNRITQNSATSQLTDSVGGGVFVYLEPEGDATASVEMTLNTVSDNTLDNLNEVGGIHGESNTKSDTLGQADGLAELTVNSAIVSGNDGIGLGGPLPGQGGVVTPGGLAEFTTTVAYNDFFGNSGGDIDAWIVPGTGNIFADPMLDPLTFVPQECSPTIDAADVALAFSEEPAPNGGRANMGHTGDTSEATAALADVSGDGIVDGVDVVRISVAFGSALGEPRYNTQVDFDDNGLVDGNDLALIAGDFGQACP
jgi:hypothetical protein